MEMLQCHFILASLIVLTGCFFEASCQSVYTYTTKDAESLPCNITEQTAGATWSEVVVGNSIRVLTYQRGTSPLVTKSIEEKYENFNYTLEPTLFNLDILKVEEEDGGVYICSPLDVIGSTYDVIVEVLVKPSVQYESQDVDVLNVTAGTSYDLTCSAAGARSVSDLSLVWDPSLVVKTPLSITPNGDYKDYNITSAYTAVRGDSSITCQLNGYAMQDEINDQRMDNIVRTVNLNVQYAPMCNMTIQEGEDCRNVTLICECDAVPADITQYSFFNESTLINEGTTNTFTLSVAFGTSTGFSCNATNDIGSGDQSGTKIHDCNKGTTALPTTTIVRTASLSTNEPTRIEAMGTTTVEPDSKSTDNPGPSALGTGAIVGIIVGAFAVVIVIVVIAVIMWKKGKCGSKSDSSYATDGNSTAKGVDIYEDELPLWFNEMKTDAKTSLYVTDGNSTAKHGDFSGKEQQTKVNKVKTDAKKSSHNDNHKDNIGKEAPPPPVYAEVKKKSVSVTDGNSIAKHGDFSRKEQPTEVNEVKTDAKKSPSLTDGSYTAQHSDFIGNKQPTEVNEVNTDVKKSSNKENRKKNYETEAPTPVYAEVKKKSDKQDNNGEGPGMDPEKTADSVIYMNTVKDNDTNRAPRSSMKDTNNSSKPLKQMEKQSPEQTHNKMASSKELRKPNEEPTEKEKQSSEQTNGNMASSKEVRKPNEEPTEMKKKSPEQTHSNMASSKEVRKPNEEPTEKEKQSSEQTHGNMASSKEKEKQSSEQTNGNMASSKEVKKPNEEPTEMEMKFVDQNYDKKPQSHLVRKPKEEPTDYATV